MSNLSYILMGLLGAAFGIFMLTSPETVINLAAVIFSMVLAAKGLKTLFYTFRFNSVTKKFTFNGSPIEDAVKNKIKRTMLFNALLSALVGLVALLIAIISFINGSAGILKGVVYVIAAGFLISGITAFVENRMMKKYDAMYDFFSDKSIVYIVSGILLFLFPFFVGHVVIYVFGALVLAAGVLSILFGVKSMKKERMQKKEEADAAVEFEDVKED